MVNDDDQWGQAIQGAMVDLFFRQDEFHESDDNSNLSKSKCYLTYDRESALFNIRQFNQQFDNWQAELAYRCDDRKVYIVRASFIEQSKES